MTVRLIPGPAATPADQSAARYVHEAVKNELVRVRADAMAWRNGVAGLLTGLVGFSLVKGRSDVGGLDRPYDWVVGLLLLAAIVTGASAAYLLLRAAHGRPVTRSLRDDGAPPSYGALGTDHAEALSALRSLRRGLVLGLTCTAFLVAAVGTTWYGPAKDKPSIEVVTPGGTRCGEVTRLRSGTLALKTSTGEVDVDLTTAVGIRAVDGCSAASP